MHIHNDVIIPGVLCGDLHFGSTGGLLPPGFVDIDGAEVGLNPGQKYLWQCWLDFCKRVRKLKPKFVIVNGDVVEGRQGKEGGAGLSLRMMTDQKKAAIVGLKRLKAAAGKDCKFYFTQGTKYHVGENAEYEESVAQELGGVRYQSIGAGDLVREVLWLEINGVIIEASHPMGGSTGFYRSTALDREMQWSAMAGKDESKGIPKADLLVRSHVHYFNVIEHASKQGVIVPCWQLQMKYARRASVHRMHPDIGGIFVEVSPRAKRRGEPACKIIKQLYTLPPVPITKI